MQRPKIDATLSLRRGERFLVGRDRIRLLEAVAEHGSISKAARALGYSYKTAWDSVDAINNLLPRPAFVTKMGGSGGGGGACVTEEGLQLIDAFRRIEEKLSRLSSRISEAGLRDNEELVLFTLGARLSSRNTFQTTIERIDKGPVDVALRLRLASGEEIVALVTNPSVEELELAPGKRVIALVKAYAVDLARHKRSGKENNIPGVVSRLVKGPKSCEVTLDIGKARKLTAVTPLERAAKLAISEGQNLIACFNPRDVIIAAN